VARGWVKLKTSGWLGVGSLFGKRDGGLRKCGDLIKNVSEGGRQRRAEVEVWACLAKAGFLRALASRHSFTSAALLL
jgi:hypothetical protein